MPSAASRRSASISIRWESRTASRVSPLSPRLFPFVARRPLFPFFESAMNTDGQLAVRRAGDGAAPRRALPVLLFLALSAFAGFVHAHKVSDSYLSLKVDAGQEGRIAGRLDVALRDLDAAIGLDANRDGKLQWDEINGKTAAIEAYAFGRLKLSAGGHACASVATGTAVDEHADGAYAAIDFVADCGRA